MLGNVLETARRFAQENIVRGIERSDGVVDARSSLPVKSSVVSEMEIESLKKSMSFRRVLLPQRNKLVRVESCESAETRKVSFVVW